MIANKIKGLWTGKVRKMAICIQIEIATDSFKPFNSAPLDITNLIVKLLYFYYFIKIYF